MLVPDLTRRHLDAFARVIARLCQAGVTSPSEMARLTRLHRDLCNQILLMLQQQRLIDSRGNLTETGRAMLAGESADASQTRLVHLFQDPFCAPSPHRLWPALVETLGYAHVDYRSGGRPRLRLDTRRDSPPVEPVVAQARRLTPPPRPSPGEIIAAARAAATASEPDGASPENEASPPTAQVSRVSFITERPDPVLLAGYLYLPDDAVTSTDWEVLDPFTGWPNAWLKESVRARLADDDTLAALLAGIEGQLTEDDAEKRRAEYTRRRAEAAVRIERRLGAPIHDTDHQKILQLLTEVEADLAEARLLADVGGRYRQTAVNNLGKVLEHVFARVHNAYPLAEHILRQLRDPVLAPKALKAALDRARELSEIGGQVPDGMLKQDGDQVARAAKGHLPSLRPLLVAVLLASAEHPDHPLRSSIRHRPDLLDRLDGTTKLRNQGSHGEDREPTAHEADDVLDLAYWTVSHLLFQQTTASRGLDVST
ncbi:hypothetical protein [Verrucosispora sp. NA02020]|uniref:hypothetical protein n=1 Tax=Verrucosispora sp. NA02020 TaxID=2742132 RepID=UPI00159031C3|nr:hypothetical protein [Verrucosispora sp. NA02020]QKW13386.1 hypothetical protein HUT12_11725 [Verrucosispora sp. NA02020]